VRENLIGYVSASTSPSASFAIPWLAEEVSEIGGKPGLLGGNEWGVEEDGFEASI
jgi:hypothetical protein